MSPRVKMIIETPRRLEPVTADPFIAGLDKQRPVTHEPRRPVSRPRPRTAGC
jgi:hypothetical protein